MESNNKRYNLKDRPMTDPGMLFAVFAIQQKLRYIERAVGNSRKRAATVSVKSIGRRTIQVRERCRVREVSKMFSITSIYISICWTQ